MRRVPGAVACFLPLIAGGAWYLAFADWTLPIFRFEFAGGERTARELVGGREDAFADALNADYVFILGYAGTIIAACLLGLRRGTGRAVLWFGIGAAVAAAVFDVVENRLLMRGITETSSDAVFVGAAVAAGLKFALVIPAAGVAVWALTRRRIPAEATQHLPAQ